MLQETDFRNRFLSLSFFHIAGGFVKPFVLDAMPSRVIRS